MKKLCVWICLLALLWIPTSACAQEDDVLAETERQLDTYDLSPWQEAASKLSDTLEMLWNGASVTDWMMDYASGEFTVDYDGMQRGVRDILQNALRQNASIMARLFAVALLTGALGTLFDDAQGMREVLMLLCYGMVVATAAAFFLDIVQSARETMAQLSAFAAMTTPVLVTMLAAVGRVTSAGMLRPLMAFLSGGVMDFFTAAVLPVVTAAGLLTIAGHLTARQELKRLGALLKSICKWMIGFVFTVYVGVVTLQGMSVAGADSIGIRTAKFTLDKAVPVVGGVVSGTLDTVRGCAVLVKNAAGAATVFLIIAYALSPVLQIAAAGLTFRLCAAVCEPVSDGRIAGMIADMGELCNYVLAVVIVVALMFMILAGLVMAVGNG
ncbi:MAG: stage III sporulation protein AE [Eubacteriales bacterium]|nr:stage III sporulation protein AE [Eubacteriales bacterium]